MTLAIFTSVVDWREPVRCSQIDVLSHRVSYLPLPHMFERVVQAFDNAGDAIGFFRATFSRLLRFRVFMKRGGCAACACAAC